MSVFLNTESGVVTTELLVYFCLVKAKVNFQFDLAAELWSIAFTCLF